jgi:hypothetical protein
MKRKQDSQAHIRQDRPIAAQLAKVAALTQIEVDFVPTPDQTAIKAYFSYLNQGAQPGHDVQHWLDSEAELIAEHKRTRELDSHKHT